jgi:hypothetical protein
MEPGAGNRLDDILKSIQALCESPYGTWGDRRWKIEALAREGRQLLTPVRYEPVTGPDPRD